MHAFGHRRDYQPEPSCSYIRCSAPAVSSCRFTQHHPIDPLGSVPSSAQSEWCSVCAMPYPSWLSNMTKGKEHLNCRVFT
ncbi:unnamed protein product [Victoria cruziana]